MVYRLVIVLGLVGLGSCGGHGGQPPGPPNPTPTPWTCEIAAPWCDQVGQTCSKPGALCVHNPTTDPNHCELAPPCSPVPIPTPTPTPTPIPTPTPTPGAFPVRFPRPAVVAYVRNSRYGNGVDSTLRINGDQELCEQLHHVPVPGGDCHFDSDVWTGPYDGALMRATYEGLVYAGARDGLPVPARPLGPVWQYKSGLEFGRCHDQREGVLVSCDHFGSAFVDGRDDPQTPAFEGQPPWLRDQRDAFGPFAGFFTVPQLTPNVPASVRACAPLSELSGPGDAAPKDSCGPWLLVDWR